MPATKNKPGSHPLRWKPGFPTPSSDGGCEVFDQFLISPLACFTSIADLSGLCLEFVKTLPAQAGSLP